MADDEECHPNVGPHPNYPERGTCGCGEAMYDTPPLIPSSVVADISHLAGIPLRIENIIRQRCLWCGAELVNVDLETRPITEKELAAIDPRDPMVGVLVYAPMSVILVSGGLTMLWHMTKSGELPDNHCANKSVIVGGAG